MPVQRTQLGGMFGGGTQPLAPQPIDYGGALEGVIRGAGSVFSTIMLRKTAQQRLAFQQQQAQAVSDWREAQAEERRSLAAHRQQIASPEFQQDFATALDENADPTQRNMARARVLAAAPEYAAHILQPPKPAPQPRIHYDAKRGATVNLDTHEVTPLDGLPPVPGPAAKKGGPQPHYDEKRGGWANPDGSFTPLQGAPALPQPAARTPTPADPAKLLPTYSQRFLTDPRIKSASDVADNALRGIAGAQQAASGNPEGDYFLINAFARIGHPGSIVRRNDKGLITEAPGIPQQIVAEYNRAVGTGGVISPKTRGMLLDNIYGAVNAMQPAVRAAISEHQKRAQSAGIDPDLFVYNPFDAIPARPAGGAGAQPGRLRMPGSAGAAPALPLTTAPSAPAGAGDPLLSKYGLTPKGVP